MKLTKRDLEEVIENEEKLDVKVIGMLLVDEDIPVELAKRAISSLKVHGAFKAKNEIKALF